MGLGLCVSMLLASKMQGQSIFIWTSAYFIPPLIFGFSYLLARLRFWQATLACLALSVPSATYVMPMVFSAWSENTAEIDSEPSFVSPDPEAIYEAQTAKRAAVFNKIRPGDPSKVELFSILGAGYPYERVFKREVLAAATHLEETYVGVDRSVALVNDMHDPSNYLLLNRTNLTNAAKALGAKMDDDDILLIFLTSHGRPGRFSTKYHGLINYDLTPEDIDNALQAAGNPNAVVIVSACYSGSFVEPLAAPNRLILTAADAESVSFGCNDENEWTEWGRAFWLNAMRETRDFREAAEQAKIAVSEREIREGFTASNPMISEGPEIGRMLASLLNDS